MTISADEYRRLKRRDQEALSLEDITEADLEAIRSAKPPCAAPDFDPEVT